MFLRVEPVAHAGPGYSGGVAAADRSSLRTALALAAGLPLAARASSDAGLELSAGKFTLQVLYSVANEYPDHADLAVADPRAALFTTAALLQANADAFSAIDHTLRIDVSLRAGAPRTVVAVVEDPYEAPGRTTTRVREDPLERDLATQLVAVVCGRYPGACRRPARATLDLHRCHAGAEHCPGRIRFGTFPSDVLDGRFAILPSRPGARPERVAREDMTRWLTPLEALPPGAPSTAAAWFVPARTEISAPIRGVCEGCEGDRDVPACRDFALGRAQIRTLLARARTITPGERAHAFDVAPCVVRAAARWDGTEVRLEVSAFLVATLRFPDGSTLALGCDGDCPAAVAGAAGPPAR